MSAQPGLESDRPTVIRAARLVAGRDRRVLRDAMVVVRGGLIEEVGPAAGGLSDRCCLDLGDATLLPGLIDAHVHLSMAAGEGIEHYRDEDRSRLEERVRAARRQLLCRGVTTVRDLGSRADVLPALRAPGAGATVLAAGPPVTTPRGHFWPLALEVQGPDSVRAAVAELSGLGVDVVKVMATGGAMTPGTAIGRAQFDPAELAVLTRAAHERGLRVAAHAHGTEGIALAVAAGVDTIEHCSWADVDGEITTPDPALLEEMARRGQVIVSAGPLPPDLLTWFETGVLPHTYRSRRQLALWRNARAAVEAGVTVALATDSVFGAVPDARDLEYRVRALVGLLDWDVVGVLELVTGAAALALNDARRGVLEPGAVADLAAFRGDLTRSPDGLGTPIAVWQGGRPVALTPQEDIFP